MLGGGGAYLLLLWAHGLQELCGGARDGLAAVDDTNVGAEQEPHLVGLIDAEVQHHPLNSAVRDVPQVLNPLPPPPPRRL